MKRIWSIVGAIVLLLLGAILSVLNVDPVPVNLWFATYEWPLIIVILGSLLLGALIATLLSTVKVYQETKRRKDAEKSVNQSQNDENEKVREVETKYEAKIDQLKEEIRLKDAQLNERTNSNHSSNSYDDHQNF